MKLIFSILASFVVLSVLFTIPLYFFSTQDLVYLSILFPAIFSVVWFVMYGFVSLVKKSKDDSSLGMKIIVGSMFFKLMASIFGLYFLVDGNYFDTHNRFHWLLFVCYYFVYTILISYFAVKWIDTKEKNAKLS